MIPFKVFAGSSHEDFAKKITKELGNDLGKTTIKQFSCGETYVKYNESFRGQDVFIVQTGRTGKMNDDLIELFLLIDAAQKVLLTISTWLCHISHIQDKIKSTLQERGFQPSYLQT